MQSLTTAFLLFGILLTPRENSATLLYALTRDALLYRRLSRSEGKLASFINGVKMIIRVFMAYRVPVLLANVMLACGLLSSSTALAQTFASASQLAFTKPFGGADPLPQVLTVASTGANFNFTATATTTTGGNWLTISPQGADCCITPEAITVTAAAAPALAPGTYQGQIVVKNYPSATITMTIPVSLTVAAAGTTFFDNLPGALSFSLKTGGVAPPFQVFQVRNGGTGTLNWSVSKSTADGGSWLTVSAASGAAPSAVGVAIVPGNLPGGGLAAGTFVGELVFASASGSVTIPVSVTVGPSVFSQVNPISFTMPVAGANPLPQILTIASTGTNFNFTVGEATATGGNWLAVSPVGTDCCITPEAVTVSVTAPAALPAGSYTGEIIFTQYPTRNISITVPVTLTVAPPTVPFLDNLPGQLSFSLKTGGLAPPFQTVQIRNKGTGTLGWALIKGTADGGNWLNASAASGNAPSTIAISIVPANLPNGGLVAGTFVGQILILSATSSVTIPINVVVGDSVFSQVNPISFTMPAAGANPLPQILTMASTGTNFNFTVAAATATGGNWLTVSPVGADCCITPEAITVSVTAPASLPVGTYTGEIIVTQYPSRNMSITVPVTLTVGSPTAPFLDNLPGQLSFSLKTGGLAPPTQAFQIRNKGTGTLGWGLITSTADGGTWLNASPTTGNAPSIVAISIVPASLPNGGLVAGTFVGQVLVLSSGSSVSIPVSVVVGASVFSQVNPISFTMPVAGANPLPQILTIASTGTNFNFTVAAATATGGSWLTVSPVGADCCITPEAVTVSVTAPASLPAGTYTGEVIVTQYPSRNMSMAVPVTLTVGSPTDTFFDNLPGQLSFSLKTGGLAPPYQTVQLRNKGTGTLNWSLSKSTADGGNWLNASPTSGTAPSTVAISITPANLPSGGLVPGTFVGEVAFASASNSVTIPVSVVVGDSVFTQVNPISFTMPQGGANPLPQILTIASTGTNFNFTVSTATATGGNWLTVSPVGADCCITPEAVTVSVTAPPSLPAGTYTGEVIFTQYPSRNMSMTVPVTLTVAAGAPFLDNLPGQLSFSLKTGGAAPPYQIVQIRNGTTGTLNWGLAKTTADGGNWLNVSVAQGTAPSLLAVSITPGGLPGGGLVAGTFVGQIQIVTASSSSTIPISVAVGDSVFTQVNPLSFTMPAGGANPLPQILTIASTGTAINFSVAAVSAKGGNFLTVSPVGLDCCITPEAVTVSVTAPAALPAGTYTGEIIVTQYPSRNLSITVPVTLIVAASGTAFFDDTQGQLSFFLNPGGGAPPSQMVQIRNGGTGTLNWGLAKTTADSGNWLSVAPVQGSAPSTLTVAITPANLPGGGLVAGTFAGQILILSASSGVSIPVSVVVGSPVFVQPAPISFTMPFGGPNPLPQTLPIASTGSAFNFSVVAATGTGGNWLQAVPQGTDCCATPKSITLSVTAPPLLPRGTYTGEIMLTQYPNRNLAMTVPVYLTVQ